MNTLSNIINFTRVSLHHQMLFAMQTRPKAGSGGDLDELTGQHSTHIEILRVGLEGLVVAQDLVRYQ